MKLKVGCLNYFNVCTENASHEHITGMFVLLTRRLDNCLYCVIIKQYFHTYTTTRIAVYKMSVKLPKTMPKNTSLETPVSNYGVRDKEIVVINCK